MWQDYAFAVGTVVFIVAFMPTIKDKQKPPLATSIPTSLVLYSFAFNYFTLKLWFAMLTTAITATQWAIVAAQRYSQQNEAK